MKTELLNLNKIFTDRIFRIPDYQRGYAWREKQLKDYWNDLFQLESSKNHYLGVLTFEDVSENKYKSWEDDLWIIKAKCFTPLYIVDGQQRLTTSIILIQAIIETNIENKKINYFTNEEIIKRYIFYSKDEGISKSYIFGYEKDNPSYEFLKTRIFLDKSDKTDSEETIYTNNLELAKEFFLEKLSELNFEELEVFFKKITQHCLFNIYTVSDDIDVNVAFEGMNNRGKPLSILELLKNRLIYLSIKLDDDPHDKVKLRNSINEAWKSVYHQLGKNKNKPLDDDTFLLNHFFYHFSSYLKLDDDLRYRLYHRRLASDYKDYLLDNLFSIKQLQSGEIDDNLFTIKAVDTNLIYHYVASLKSSVQTWFKILNPTQSDFSRDEKKLLQSIYRIKPNSETEYFMVLILVFYEKVDDPLDRIKLLQLIEKMLFFDTLSSFRYYSTFPDFNDESLLELAVSFAKDEKNKNGILNDLHYMWQSWLSRDHLVTAIIHQFKSRGFYAWNGLRYFLYEYEEHLKSQSKTKRDKLDWDQFTKEHDDDYTTIEHIYPQTARKKCWSSLFGRYSQPQRYALKDSLGNLLPLSRAKNSSLGNRCFNEKINNNDNTVGYSYGCYSEIQVSLEEKWTAKEILVRGIKMVIFLQERWGFRFESKLQVIRFLGLEFLIKKDNINIDEIFHSLGVSGKDGASLTRSSSRRAKSARR